MSSRRGAAWVRHWRWPLRQHQCDLARGVLQLLEEFRADCQQIATGWLHDLLDASKARPHDLGRVPVLLVVVIDARDRLNTRIIVRRNFARVDLAPSA